MLTRNLPIRKLLDQIGVLACREAVADALGVQIERPPDRFGRCGLARVRRKTQAVILGVSVNTAEKFRCRLLLVPPDAYADHMPVPVPNRQLKHLLCGFHSKMAG